MTDKTATERLRELLDEFEHECFMIRVEASETRAKDDVVRKAYERQRDETAQAIVATLGEADEGCYLMYDGKKYPVELDFGFLGLMPITITVGGFRYLVEVPDGE